ncbi:hypothetical protein O181_121824 [Austropuccinia psidii MF-1]|uniref:CID domain-containing protein n=1 Tax=Austropuccinia psidii MF-1 TaxID=1389203 RepID=A0A9Q3Q1R3_9BASI|nr:hypothetical protein [Austropuccinia psidii MF-1]
MLRSLTPQQERIAQCMAFALHHADAADEVAEIIVQSLMIDMTPIPRKLARLYVISDILHNSSNSLPNVWKYRQILEKLLPDVFDHLNLIYRLFPGRIKAKTFKKQICAIVNFGVLSWCLARLQSTNDLNQRLIRLNDEDKEAQHEVNGEGVMLPKEAADDDVDGVVADDPLLWATEGPQCIGGPLAEKEEPIKNSCSQSGFAKAFKPAVMEPSHPSDGQSSEPGVKLGGAIRLL